MGKRSVQERKIADATARRGHAKRLNFCNPGQREAHIQAFLAWLPKLLHEAPGIRWEDLPSQVMGYLIRTVAASPDAGVIALAVGSALDQREKVLYGHCCRLAGLLKRLRSRYGMTTLTDLSQRTIWDRFVEGRDLSMGEIDSLQSYEAFAFTYLPAFFDGLTERQQVVWKSYLLPQLPRKFLDHKAQRKAVRAATENRRKEQSDIVLPLFPLLVEIVQLRKQAAERLVKEFRKQRDRAIAGEIALPYQFEYVDRSFSVSEQATSLAEVQLIEREVTLSLILWKRTKWVEDHPDLYGREAQRTARKQQVAYTPEHDTYFFQYDGPESDLLWCGDLLAKGLLRQGNHDRFSTQRSALLSPAKSAAHWLLRAGRLSGKILFEPEPLYRGTLFAAALATLSLPNGSRASELLQVSASRFETIIVDELKNQHPTGRKMGILVQNLLPKGHTHESERQYFLISDMAVRHLKEIAELLQTHHGGSIPIVHPNSFGTKAEDLLPEPYFFQWAASPDGRLGHLSSQDISNLLRFLFHGLTLTTRNGTPIRIAPHLLRHVLATHARTVKNIPAEALAYLLHHRVVLPHSNEALTLPEATAYYSRFPVTHLLVLLFEVQSTLISDQECSYLQTPSPQTMEQMDEMLRTQFERCGMLGPTVLGFCSAGTCIRPDNRGICAHCSHLVPHYSNISKAKTWRKLYILQAKLHDEQGHAVDAAQARKVTHYPDDMIRVMEIQVRTRQDGGYLPFADTLLPDQENEERNEL